MADFEKTNGAQSANQESDSKGFKPLEQILADEQAKSAADEQKLGKEQSVWSQPQVEAKNKTGFHRRAVLDIGGSLVQLPGNIIKTPRGLEAEKEAELRNKILEDKALRLSMYDTKFQKDKAAKIDKANKEKLINNPALVAALDQGTYKIQPKDLVTGVAMSVDDMQKLQAQQERFSKGGADAMEAWLEFEKPRTEVQVNNELEKRKKENIAKLRSSISDNDFLKHTNLRLYQQQIDRDNEEQSLSSENSMANSPLTGLPGMVHNALGDLFDNRMKPVVDKKGRINPELKAQALVGGLSNPYSVYYKKGAEQRVNPNSLAVVTDGLVADKIEQHSKTKSEWQQISDAVQTGARYGLGNVSKYTSSPLAEYTSAVVRGAMTTASFVDAALNGTVFSGKGFDSNAFFDALERNQKVIDKFAPASPEFKDKNILDEAAIMLGEFQAGGEVAKVLPFAGNLTRARNAKLVGLLSSEAKPMNALTSLYLRGYSSTPVKYATKYLDNFVGMNIAGTPVVYTNAYIANRRQGDSREEASKKAAIESQVLAGTMSIFGTFLHREPHGDVAKTMLGKPEVKNWVGKRVEKVNQAFNNVGMPAPVKIAQKTAMGSLEFSMFDSYMEYRRQKEEHDKLIENGQIPKNTAFKMNPEKLLIAAKHGAMMGGVVGAIGAVRDGNTDFLQGDAVALSIKDPDQFKLSIQRGLDNGYLTAESAKQLISFVAVVKPKYLALEGATIPVFKNGKQVGSVKMDDNTRVALAVRQARMAEIQNNLDLYKNKSEQYSERKIIDLEIQAANEQRDINKLETGTVVKGQLFTPKDVAKMAKDYTERGMLEKQRAELKANGAYKAETIDLEQFKTDEDVKAYLAVKENSEAAQEFKTQLDEIETKLAKISAAEKLGKKLSLREQSEKESLMDERAKLKADNALFAKHLDILDFSDPHNLAPVIGKDGNIIDGKKRIAAAIAKGDKNIEVLRPLTEAEHAEMLNEREEDVFGANEPNYEGLDVEDAARLRAARAAYDNAGGGVAGVAAAKESLRKGEKLYETEQAPEINVGGNKPTFENVPILTFTAEEAETAKNEIFDNLNKLEVGSVIENSDGEIKVVTEKTTYKNGNQLIGIVTYERQEDGSLIQRTNPAWVLKSADGKIKLDYNPHTTGRNSKGERVTVTDQITDKKIDLSKENIFTKDENGNLVQINKAKAEPSQTKPEEPTQTKPEEPITEEKLTDLLGRVSPEVVNPVLAEAAAKMDMPVPKVKPVSETEALSPKNMKDLYNINRELFGLNRVKALASAAVMDRMIGAMAKRAGISKADMYSKLEFRKDVEENLLKMDNALFQAKIGGKEVTLRNVDVDVVNGFYSPLEKIIKESKQDKLPVKQWIEKFAKGEEAKWTGLQDWLAQQEGSLSKQEVLDFLKSSRINVVEIVLEEGSGKTAKERFNNERLVLTGDYENYKEILVTLPHRPSFNELRDFFNSKDRKGKSFDNLTRDEFVDLQTEYRKWKQFKSTHFDEPNILVHLRLNTRTDADGNKVLFLEEVQSDYGQKGREEGFKDLSFSWDSQLGKDATVVLKRMNETAGFNDWQELARAMAKSNDILNDFQVPYDHKDLMLKWHSAVNQSKKVAAAPFVMNTPDWVKLGLKVALKEAVKQGADKIAWTTGEQQNDRYSLENQVDEIRARKNEDGTYKINAAKDGVNVFMENNVDAKKLSDIVGKDLAEKIINDKSNEGKFTQYRGQDLKVGGKGMKGFYGSSEDGSKGIVGGVAEKVFKQKVGEIEINTGEEPPLYVKKYHDRFAVYSDEDIVEFFDTEKEAQKYIDENPTTITGKQFSIDITPELRSEVERGLALFQKQQGMEAKGAMVAADSKFIVYALTDPNVSTPVHELAHVFEHYLTDAERAVVQSWAGTEAWTTKTSESFARGFEKYLADGKAPSSTLQKVFDKFKEWLTDIYNGVKGSDIDLELNDQMRELYSKMVDVSPKAKEIAGKLTERIKAGKQQAGDLKNIDADQYSEEREEAKTEYEAQLENELEELREAYADVTRSEAELRKIQNNKSKSLSKFVDRLLNGTTEQDVIDAKAKLADAKKKYREAKAALTAQLPRERGSNYIIERLSRAARQGEISQEAADLAIDLVRANPELFEDLAISITKAPQGSDALGFYRAAEALVKVFKGGTDDLTATHELLHHTERFLPLEIRDKILEEWSTQIDKQIADLKSKLAKEKNPDTRNDLINKLLYLGIAKERQIEPNAQNRKDMERIMSKYMRGYVDSKGRMQKGIGKDWYQYSNPSEWWAVNASKLYAEAKNKPQLRTWLDKAKAFYDQLIASAKRVFKGSRTAAVEKGLKAILNGETLSSREGEVLAQTKGLSAKGEVLFQLVGENAELAQDVRDNLQVARNMEAAGKDAKTIRIATGWEKGKDGKWRYEILDGHLKGEVRTFKGNLSDIIESKELFNAYPQLAKLEVDLELGSGLNGFDKGAYYARRSKIEVNGSRENVLPILLHEIQHAIQEIEGFAKGGNPSQMTTPNDVLQELASPLSFPKLSKEDRLIAKQKTREQGLRFGETFYFDVIKDDIYELHDLVDRLEILNSVSPNEAYVKLIDALDYKIMEMRGENVAFDKYKKLVGEVEARNVQNRMGMTPEQRRETLLSETEDVARDEQIVLFDSNGVQMQVDTEQTDLQTIKDFIEEQRKEGVSEEDIKEGVRLAAKELGIKDVDSLFSEKDSTFDPKAEYEASFEGKASSRAIREAKMPFVDKYFKSIVEQLEKAKKITKSGCP